MLPFSVEKSPELSLLSVSNPYRMWSLHRLGNPVQMQPGRYALEHGLLNRQLHALILSPVQAQASES